MFPEVCKEPMSVGHCRGYEERWFYEWAKSTCEPFGFSGCGGNGNNFRTRDHCLRACVTRVNATEENGMLPVHFVLLFFIPHTHKKHKYYRAAYV